MVNGHIDFYIKVLSVVIDVRAKSRSVRVRVYKVCMQPTPSQRPMFLCAGYVGPWSGSVSRHFTACAQSSSEVLPDNMFSKRLTKVDRERTRAQRREAQLIIARAKERRFEYVVNPPVIPKVAFGSGLHRETLPRTGPNMTSFMRRNQGEVRDYPGPFEHVFRRRLCKHQAKMRSSMFASKTPRIPEITDSRLPPGAYDVEVRKQPKSTVQPFSLGSPAPKCTFLTPGPPTYPYHKPYPKYKLSNAFGSKRVIWPAVAVFCTPNNTAKCYKCGGTPIGDYWHNFSTNTDMCRPCMNKEQQVLKNCATDVFQRMLMRRDLQQFKQARYCGFFHNHNGTSAALQIMSTKTLRYKIKTENYLYLFDKR